MQSQPKPSRPNGVTILAAIAILGGVFGLLGGAAVLSGTAAEPQILAVVVVLFAILGLALGMGFLQGKGWAWTIGVTTYILSLPLGAWEIVTGGAGTIGGSIRVIVGVVILYYLTRSHVKAFFGRGVSSNPPLPAV